MSDISPSVALARQIVECIGIADGLRLHTVAAYLDAALVALQGTGVWPVETVADLTPTPF